MNLFLIIHIIILLLLIIFVLNKKKIIRLIIINLQYVQFRSSVYLYVKSCLKHAITVSDVIFEQEKANGNREYSSTTVNRYWLCDFDGNGPLKSMLSLSNGAVALIRVPVCL